MATQNTSKNNDDIVTMLRTNNGKGLKVIGSDGVCRS